jgi:hypothetical protein
MKARAIITPYQRTVMGPRLNAIGCTINFKRKLQNWEEIAPGEGIGQMAMLIPVVRFQSKWRQAGCLSYLDAVSTLRNNGGNFELCLN